MRSVRAACVSLTSTSGNVAHNPLLCTGIWSEAARDAGT